MSSRKGSSRAPAADVFTPECPSRSVLNHISSRWGVLVLLALRDGTLRFGELKRAIGGISEKMLSQTLSALERDGFVLRTAHAVIPPHVDYQLTTLGDGLTEHVEDLIRFVEGNLGDILASQRRHDRRK